MPSQFVFSSKTTQQSPLNLTPQLEFGFRPIISSTSTSKPFFFSSDGIIKNTKSSKSKSKPAFSFSAPGASSRFKFSNFDQIIDETDTLVAPRLPRQPEFISSNGQDNFKFQNQNNNEINIINHDHHDAFFFTTTPKPTTNLGGAGQTGTGNSHSGSGGSSSSHINEIHKIKPGIFDMRKFFFIPQKTKKLHVNNNNNIGGGGGHPPQGPGQAERRVHHLHQHHFHHVPHVPHRGFHFRG